MKMAKSLKIRDLSFKYCSWEKPVLGLAVSKHYGNSVKRNLFKRRCRELFKKKFIDQGVTVALIICPMKKEVVYGELNYAFNELYGKIND